MRATGRTYAKTGSAGQLNVKGARQARMPATFSPMLATLVDDPISQQGWIYEPKLDGIRAIAMIRQGRVSLVSRRGLDLTSQFPKIVSDLEKYSDRSLILDGEIVALDAKNRPSFQLLQQRASFDSKSKYSVVYYVFDIAYLDGYSLVGVELADRKELLVRTLKVTRAVQLVEYFQGDPITFFEACVKNGMEGMVEKRVDSAYETGRRSRAWLKVKSTNSAEFLIAGYTIGTGARNSTFGSLVLGYYDEHGRLNYAGRVGTGFDDKLLRDILKRIGPLKTNVKPFAAKVPIASAIQWLKPELVAEIKFAELTNDGRLRVPVFLRLREDIDPRSVRLSSQRAEEV